jgi:hypothetical protein
MAKSPLFYFEHLRVCFLLTAINRMEWELMENPINVESSSNKICG